MRLKASVDCQHETANYYSIMNNVHNATHLLSVSIFLYIPRLTDYRIFDMDNPPHSDYQKVLYGEAMNQSKSPFLESVCRLIQVKHLSYRTEEAYIGWIRRYILLHDKRHPNVMHNWMLTERNVVGSPS